MSWLEKMPDINLAKWDAPHMHGKGCSKITSAVLCSDCSESLQTEQTLRIMNSCNDTDELCLIHSWLHFFARAVLGSQQKAAVLGAGHELPPWVCLPAPLQHSRHCMG